MARGKVENESSAFQVCRKRGLNGAVSRINRIKRWPRVGARAGTFTEPRNVYGVWSLTVGQSFVSPPAHLCVVTYMTEISLIVKLNNKGSLTIFHASYPSLSLKFSTYAFL